MVGAGWGYDVSRTVNSPVSLSMLTWVTCIGLVGVEMVGLRGEPSMLFMKLENVPFFLPPSDLRFLVLEASASSEYRWRGDLVPPSERGGVIVSFILRARVKLALWRSLGDLEGFFCCWGGARSDANECCWGRGGRWVASAAVMLLLMAAASKGAPTSSGVVRSECEELAAEGPLPEVREMAGFEVWRRSAGGDGDGCGAPRPGYAAGPPRCSALRCWWRKEG